MDHMLDDCAADGCLSESIELINGPRLLLNGFFAWADEAASERGVKLRFASLHDLVRANESQSSSWRPLVPIFNPALSGATDGTAFAILGRNKQGEIVASQAARVYDWSASSLQDEASSLRMFYADTAAAKSRGDRCVVTAPIAAKIRGRVVFSGAGWYRPDFRGRGLATILPRISRAYAFTR
jgi:hypothetical protein